MGGEQDGCYEEWHFTITSIPVDKKLGWAEKSRSAAGTNIKRSNT